MKRNLRVIQINGFRGLLLTLFIISCLIAGFIVFPAFLTMNVWNYLAIKTSSFHSINFYGGALLWAIITLSVFTFSKKKFIVSFNAQHEFDENELKDAISKKIKMLDLELNRDPDIENVEQETEIENK